jgi:hypothetical protein
MVIVILDPRRFEKEISHFSENFRMLDELLKRKGNRLCRIAKWVSSGVPYWHFWDKTETLQCLFLA